MKMDAYSTNTPLFYAYYRALRKEMGGCKRIILPILRFYLFHFFPNNSSTEISKAFAIATIS
jgi:hypothetical protein